MSDPLKDPIILMHTIFISCIGYVIVYNLYYFIKRFFWFYGISKLNIFANIPVISLILYYIFFIAYRLAIYASLILLVILFWIFCFWMAIILFVPFVIIFPIPIFPFIFILPLKSLMLLLIPPFKTLTDLGTLPLIYKISSRIGTGNIFYNFFDYFLYPTADDVSKYLYYNVNQIVQDTSGYDISDYYIPSENVDIDDEFKNKTDDYSGKTKEMKDLETNDDPKDIDKYREYKNNPTINEGMKKIEEETQMCINIAQKFKPYNASYTQDVQIDTENSFSPYNECYIKAIKSYLKTSII
jgi:hypothetical protein